MEPDIVIPSTDSMDGSETTQSYCDNSNNNSVGLINLDFGKYQDLSIDEIIECDFKYLKHYILYSKLFKGEFKTNELEHVQEWNAEHPNDKYSNDPFEELMLEWDIHPSLKHNLIENLTHTTNELHSRIFIYIVHERILCFRCGTKLPTAFGYGSNLDTFIKQRYFHRECFEKQESKHIEYNSDEWSYDI